MHVVDELLLPKIEKIEPGILSSHPQHATPILIDGHDGVTVEAIPIAFIVLKPARETFSSPVKVIETLARRHPQSILTVREKFAINRPALDRGC